MYAIWSLAARHWAHVCLQAALLLCNALISTAAGWLGVAVVNTLRRELVAATMAVLTAMRRPAACRCNELRGGACLKVGGQSGRFVSAGLKWCWMGGWVGVGGK